MADVPPPPRYVYKGEARCAAWGHSSTSPYSVRFLLDPDLCRQLGGHPFEGLAGRRFVIGVIPLPDEETTHGQGAGARGERGSAWDAMPPAEQSGVLCKERPSFRRFLYRQDHAGRAGEYDPDEAAASVRRRCGVTSRAELNTNKAAAAAWRRLAAAHFREENDGPPI